MNETGKQDFLWSKVSSQASRLFPFKLVVKIENRSVRERARSRKNPNYAAAATGRQLPSGVSERENLLFLN